MSKPFINKQAFYIKESIKSFGGKWNSENKYWEVEEKYHSQLKAEADKISRKKSDLWEKACTMENVNAVKKDSPQYDDVKKRYVDLLMTSI